MYNITPPDLVDILAELVHPNHALVVTSDSAGATRILAHQWPSWLQQGTPRIVRTVLDLFYPSSQVRGDFGVGSSSPYGEGPCRHCG